jgi:hypothetical protein
MKSKIFLILALMANLNALAQGGSYNLWFEFGNGTFVKRSFTELSPLTNYLANSLPANNNSGTNYTYKKLVPIYKPPPPPGLMLAYRQVMASEGVEFATTNPPLDSNLYIYSSTNDFISADTVMMALHYKKKNPNAKKLAFFYNSNANSSFIPITEFDNAYLVPNDQSGMPRDMLHVRTYKNEQPKVASNQLMESVGQGFNNGLVFDLLNPENTVSNIFLTINTFEEINIEDNEQFKLVFLSADNKALGNYNSNMLNHSGLKSHDPNYEKVTPECLKFPEGGGTILNYDIHFQNIGLGPALKVVTTTTLPQGYTINDIVNLNTLPWEVAKQLRNTNYTIDISASTNDKLIIAFNKKPATNIILKGTLGMDDPLSDATTMGDFSFKLKVKSPLSGPQDLVSRTSIVFDDNEPVVTNNAIVRVRKCCTCPDGKKKNDGQPNAGKCKGKSKLAKWLFCEGC